MKQDIHDTNWGQQLNDWEQAPAPSPSAWDTPPDALWPRIEQDLPPRKRRRPFFIWLLGVGLLGLVGAWWYVSGAGMSNDQFSMTNAQVPAAELAKSVSKSEIGSTKSERSIRVFEDFTPQKALKGRHTPAKGETLRGSAKSDSKSEVGSTKSEGRIREFEDFTPQKALKGRHTPAKGETLRGSAKSDSKSEVGSTKSERSIRAFEDFTSQKALKGRHTPAKGETLRGSTKSVSKSEVGSTKSEGGNEPADTSLNILASSHPQILASLIPQILDSSNPRFLKSSNLQILKSSNLQILDSSIPQILKSSPSDFPKWSIGASLLYGVPSTTKARLPGRTFHFEAQTGWGLQVQRQLTPKWHVQTGLSRQTLDYRVDTRFVRLINFNDETPNGNVRTSTVNLTTALKADADDASPVELERPASSGSNFPNRVVLVTLDAVDIRKISVPLQVGYRVWQHYPFRLDAQAGMQWTSYRAEIVRESIRVEHNFFQLRSPDVQRRPPLVVNGNYFQWSAGLTASVHLHPNWQLALQAQTLSGRTEVLERLSAFTPQVDFGVRYRF